MGSIIREELTLWGLIEVKYNEILTASTIIVLMGIYLLFAIKGIKKSIS